MATAAVPTKKAHTRRGSLSVVKPREERLDKTQGLHESDYHLQGNDVELGVGLAATAVPLDIFDYTQLEDVTHLASGAFSHVYAAKHRGRDVVVKLLREQYKDSSVTLKQMRFEQVLLSQLRHKNIVDFMGTGSYNGVPFTVLERLDETLNQRISGEERLTMMESLTYAKMVGEALVYIHEGAIAGQITLHRDLKPDNLAFDEAGVLKLIDFGLARSVPAGTSIDEVYEMTGETGSLRYSLSLILWQMVQGTKPFQGMSRKDFFHHVVHRHFRPAIDPKWPAALSSLIVRSWDPDQLKRPTAREFVVGLDAIVNSMNRHRRNSTGNPTGLGRMRSVFQMMKERAGDYVVVGGAATRRTSKVEGDDHHAIKEFVPEPEPEPEPAQPVQQQQHYYQQQQQQQQQHAAADGAGQATGEAAAPAIPPHKRRNSF